jgi:hypothetical protein
MTEDGMGPGHTNGASEQRRRGRISQEIPITLTASDAEGTVFSEETKTVVLWKVKTRCRERLVSHGGGRGDRGELRGEAEAGIGSGDDEDFSAVRAENIARNGKAESGVIRVGLEERIEETGKVCGGEVGAGMIDQEFDATVGARLPPEVDGIAGGGVVDGMREDVRERGSSFGFVDEGGEIAWRRERELDIAGSGRLRGCGGDGAQRLSEIDGSAIDSRRPGIRDKIRDQAVKARRFLTNGINERVSFRRRKLLVADESE